MSILRADNRSKKSFHSKISVLRELVYSEKSRFDAERRVRESCPSIVHVHNFFPLLTPFIYDAFGLQNLPIVQTLHNYRVICPGAMLMRNEQVCEKCVKGSPYNAVIGRCYRNSVVGSFAVARMVDYHRKRDTWKRKVDRFIALTDFAKSKFVSAGFPAHKVATEPNFVRDPLTERLVQKEKGGYALFVGRISAEKGAATLVKAWDSVDYPLRIVGDGPALRQLRLDNSSEKVTFLEWRDKESVYQMMCEAEFLVMPSIWYEGFPVVLLEALAHGVAIICPSLAEWRK